MGGPFDVDGLGGERYILLIIDSHTKARVIGYCKTKSPQEVFHLVRHLLWRLSSRGKFTVSWIRSDNQGEFLTPDLIDLLIKNGICQQVSAPDTPESNGIVEVAIAHTITCSIALLEDAGLHDMPFRVLWPYASHTATYIFNLQPSLQIPRHAHPDFFISPMERCTGVVPDISHLRVFGRLCVVHIPKLKRSKLDLRGYLGIFLGYSDAHGRGVYMVLNLTTRRVVPALHVHVLESLRLCDYESYTPPSHFAPVSDDSLDVLPPDVDWLPPPHLNDQVAMFSPHHPSPTPTPLATSQYAPPSPSSQTLPPVPAAPSLHRPRQPLHLDADGPPKYSLRQRVSAPTTYWAGVQTPHGVQPIVTSDGLCHGTILRILQRPKTGAFSRCNRYSVRFDFDGKTDVLKECDLTPSSIAPLLLLSALPASHTLDSPSFIDFEHDSASYFPDYSSTDNLGISLTDTTYDSETAFFWRNLVFLLPASSSTRSSSTPRNITDALSGPNQHLWHPSVNAERHQIFNARTYDSVPISSVPSASVILRLLWVFKEKFMPDGSLEKCKSRLCVMDVNSESSAKPDNYSPVVSYVTLRLFIAIAAFHGLPIFQYDFDNAFLNADLPSPVWVHTPPGFPEFDPLTGERLVWRLRKSLYGLQNAPRLWFNLVNASLLSLGFTPHVLDPCFYLKFFNNLFVLIVLYVDDMGICGTWTSEVDRVKSTLFSNYKMKDLGLAGTSRTFLSLQLVHSSEGIYIHQRHYIETLIERANLQGSKPRSVPIQDTLDKFLLHATLDLSLSDICSNLIGGLLFIARISRLDIVNIARELSMHTRFPSSKLLQACNNVILYLKDTVHLAYFYSRRSIPTNPFPSLHCYSDASFNVTEGKSVTGGIHFLGTGPISACSILQPKVSMDTTVAEYVAAAINARQLMYLRQLLAPVYPQFTLPPTEMFMDNEAAISIATNVLATPSSKYIELRWHFVRECCTDGHILIQALPSTRLCADMCTKNLRSMRLYSLRSQVFRSIPSSSSDA